MSAADLPTLQRTPHILSCKLSVLQTIATLAADPIASLVDTAFIGHLGMTLYLVPVQSNVHASC